jgi:hypothetical protein
MPKLDNGGCLVSEKGNVWKSHSSAPEAMPKFEKGDCLESEKGNVWKSHSSAPEAMPKFEKVVCLESEKVNVWKRHSSAPEAMPKVGTARGLNMNTYKFQTSHPSVPEDIVQIDGGSSTIVELEPRLEMGMGGERPRSPQMVSEMDGPSKLQFNPTAPSPLDGNIKSKLGMIDIKGQIAAATKSDDANVPEYLWDMRALGLERPLKDMEKKYLDMLSDVMLFWWKRQVVKSLCKYLEMPWERESVVESQITNTIHGEFCCLGWAKTGRASY